MQNLFAIDFPTLYCLEVCERKIAKAEGPKKPVAKSAALAKLKANMSVGTEVGDLLDVEQRNPNPRGPSPQRPRMKGGRDKCNEARVGPRQFVGRIHLRVY